MLILGGLTVTDEYQKQVDDTELHLIRARQKAGKGESTVRELLGAAEHLISAIWIELGESRNAGVEL